MNNEQEILARLGRIEQMEKRRTAFAVLGTVLSLIAVAAVLWTVFTVVPMVEDVYTQIQPALGNVEKMTDSLSQVDWSQLNKLEDLDVAELNQAITNLNAAVEALENAFAPIRDFVGKLFQ